MIRKSFQPFNTADDMSSEALSEDVLQKSESIYAAEVSADGGATEHAQTDGDDDYASIRQWAKEDRPREKMMERGAGALTKAELLAILIGSGTTRKSAVDLMREIMRDCDDKLSRLSKMSLDALMSYNGIGEAKALTIMAAAEIGRRRAEEETGGDAMQFVDAGVVLSYMRPKVQDLDHEESWVLLLNNRACLIRLLHLSKGGLTETSVDVRILLKEALMANATSFILVHNHPSGNPVPSNADKTITEQIRKASKTMNIRMLDHVIVTDSKDIYYSFAENGSI